MHEPIDALIQVAECAVVPVVDDIKGHVPVAFVVLKAGSTAATAGVQAEIVKLVIRLSRNIADHTLILFATDSPANWTHCLSQVGDAGQAPAQDSIRCVICDRTARHLNQPHFAGKILRKKLSKIANGETFKIPPTIDDPEILSEIKASWQAHPK